MRPQALRFTLLCALLSVGSLLMASPFQAIHSLNASINQLKDIANTEIILISPEDGSEFSSDDLPDFSWGFDHPSCEQLSFQLTITPIEGDQSPQQAMQSNQPVQIIGDLNEMHFQLGKEVALPNGEYSWRVEAMYNGTAVATSETYMFRMINRCLEQRSYRVTCRGVDPATGADIYDVELVIFNNTGYSGDIITFQPNPYTAWPVCNGNIGGISTPISVPSTGFVTLNFTITDLSPADNPFYIWYQFEYNPNQGSPPDYCDSVFVVELPNCRCCDEFDKAVDYNSITHLGGGDYNINMDMSAGPDNIVSVNAQLVYMAHRSSEEGCASCTRDSRYFGSLGEPSIINGLSGPDLTSAGSSDGYSNEIIWGGDMGNFVYLQSGINIDIPLFIPEPPEISCCSDRVDFCIRYSFTDINCVTCDTLVCYSLSRGSDGGLTGGPDKESDVLTKAAEMMEESHRDYVHVDIDGYTWDIPAELDGAAREEYIENMIREKDVFEHTAIPRPELPSPETTDCRNGGFEDGNAGFWQGATGLNSGGTPIGSGVNSVVPGFVFPNYAWTPVGDNPYWGQHAIMPDATWAPTGFDPRLLANGVNLPVVYDGNFSMRIGNDRTAGGSESRWVSILRKTVTVDPVDPIFVYHYAAVIQLSHDRPFAGFFQANFYDASTGTLIDQMSVVGEYGDPFMAVSTGPAGTIFYRDWTCVEVDLHGYEGRQVIVEFMSADCSAGAHYGYAYIDAACDSACDSYDCCENTDIRMDLSANLVRGGIQISGNTSAGPALMREVDITLVDFRIVPNEKECLSCTSNNLEYGTIHHLNNPFPGLPGPVYTNSSGGSPIGGLNESTRELIWGSDAATPVDLSGPNAVRLYLYHPDLLDLSCCEGRVQFCLRIEYTDENCNKCSELQCFTVSL